jgi:hypothetical protein
MTPLVRQLTGLTTSPNPNWKDQATGILSSRTVMRSSARKVRRIVLLPPGSPATPDIHDKLSGGVDHNMESVLIDR